MGIYFMLFHGRKAKDEKLEDWGSDGPIFGPLDWVHTTYAYHVKLGIPEEDDMTELIIDDDLLYYDGVWYGDWSAFTEEVFEESDKLKKRWTKYDHKKTRLPEAKGKG